MYGKNGDNNSLHYHNSPINSDSSKNLSQSSAYTIIWWRAIDKNNENPITSWKACKLLTYVDKSISKESSEKLVKKLFGGDFYFCFIKNTGEHSGLFIPTLNN